MEQDKRKESMNSEVSFKNDLKQINKMNIDLIVQSLYSLLEQQSENTTSVGQIYINSFYQEQYLSIQASILQQKNKKLQEDKKVSQTEMKENQDQKNSHIQMRRTIQNGSEKQKIKIHKNKDQMDKYTSLLEEIQQQQIISYYQQQLFNQQNLKQNGQEIQSQQQFSSYQELRQSNSDQSLEKKSDDKLQSFQCEGAQSNQNKNNQSENPRFSNFNSNQEDSEPQNKQNWYLREGQKKLEEQKQQQEEEEEQEELKDGYDSSKFYAQNNNKQQQQQYVVPLSSNSYQYYSNDEFKQFSSSGLVPSQHIQSISSNNQSQMKTFLSEDNFKIQEHKKSYFLEQSQDFTLNQESRGEQQNHQEQSSPQPSYIQQNVYVDLYDKSDYEFLQSTENNQQQVPESQLNNEINVEQQQPNSDYHFDQSSLPGKDNNEQGNQKNQLTQIGIDSQLNLLIDDQLKKEQDELQQQNCNDANQTIQQLYQSYEKDNLDLISHVKNSNQDFSQTENEKDESDQSLQNQGFLQSDELEQVNSNDINILSELKKENDKSKNFIEENILDKTHDQNQNNINQLPLAEDQVFQQNQDSILPTNSTHDYTQNQEQNEIFNDEENKYSHEQSPFGLTQNKTKQQLETNKEIFNDDNQNQYSLPINDQTQSKIFYENDNTIIESVEEDQVFQSNKNSLLPTNSLQDQTQNQEQIESFNYYENQSLYEQNPFGFTQNKTKEQRETNKENFNDDNQNQYSLPINDQTQSKIFNENDNTIIESVEQEQVFYQSKNSLLPTNSPYDQTQNQEQIESFNYQENQSLYEQNPFGFTQNKTKEQQETNEENFNDDTFYKHSSPINESKISNEHDNTMRESVVEEQVFQQNQNSLLPINSPLNLTQNQEQSQSYNQQENQSLHEQNPFGFTQNKEKQQIIEVNNQNNNDANQNQNFLPIENYTQQNKLKENDNTNQLDQKNSTSQLDQQLNIQRIYSNPSIQNNSQYQTTLENSQNVNQNLYSQLINNQNDNINYKQNMANDNFILNQQDQKLNNNSTDFQQTNLYLNVNADSVIQNSCNASANNFALLNEVLNQQNQKNDQQNKTNNNHQLMNDQVQFNDQNQINSEQFIENNYRQNNITYPSENALTSNKKNTNQDNDIQTNYECQHNFQQNELQQSNLNDTLQSIQQLNQTIGEQNILNLASICIENQNENCNSDFGYTQRKIDKPDQNQHNEEFLQSNQIEQMNHNNYVNQNNLLSQNNQVSLNYTLIESSNKNYEQLTNNNQQQMNNQVFLNEQDQQHIRASNQRQTNVIYPQEYTYQSTNKNVSQDNIPINSTQQNQLSYETNNSSQFNQSNQNKFMNQINQVYKNQYIDNRQNQQDQQVNDRNTFLLNQYDYRDSYQNSIEMNNKNYNESTIIDQSSLETIQNQQNKVEDEDCRDNVQGFNIKPTDEQLMAQFEIESSQIFSDYLKAETKNYNEQNIEKIITDFINNNQINIQNQKLELEYSGEPTFYQYKGPQYLIYLLKYEKVIKKFLITQKIEVVDQNDFSSIFLKISSIESLLLLKQLFKVLESKLIVYSQNISQNNRDSQKNIAAMTNHLPFRDLSKNKQLQYFYNKDERTIHWFSFTKSLQEIQNFVENVVSQIKFKRLFIQNFFNEKGISDNYMTNEQKNFLNLVSVQRQKFTNYIINQIKNNYKDLSIHYKEQKAQDKPNFKEYTNFITVQYEAVNSSQYQQFIDFMKTQLSLYVEFIIEHKNFRTQNVVFITESQFRENVIHNQYQSYYILFIDEFQDFTMLPANKNIVNNLKAQHLQPTKGIIQVDGLDKNIFQQ